MIGRVNGTSLNVQEIGQPALVGNGHFCGQMKLEPKRAPQPIWFVARKSKGDFGLEPTFRERRSEVLVEAWTI